MIWVKRTPEYFCEKGWTPSRRFARRNDQNRIQHGSSARFAWRSMRRPRRAGSLSNFSHVKSIGSFWTEIYQETMVSHVYYTPAATWTTQSKFLPRPMRFLSTDPGVHHHEAARHARRLFLFAETGATLQCPAARFLCHAYNWMPDPSSHSYPPDAHLPGNAG